MNSSEISAKPRSAKGAVASTKTAKSKTATNTTKSPAPKRKKAITSELVELNSATPAASSIEAAKSKSPKAAARAAVAEQMPDKLADVAEFVAPAVDPSAEIEAEETQTQPVEAASADPEEVKPTYHVLAEGEIATSFHQLPLSPPMLDVLDERGFSVPTPIQAQAIPVIASGADLLGIAQTGTGKTLAFGLPILERIFSGQSKGRALILLPTRELALQVEEALQNVGHKFRLRTAVLIGGAPVRPQLSQIRRNPDVIIATPGRLNDYLSTRDVDLRTVDCVVLDEADRMLDMGFAPQIRRILEQVPTERQTLLFSATMPDEIVELTKEFMREPQRVEIERAGTTAENIEQRLYVVDQEEKTNLVEKLLTENEGSVLIFARTRSRANKVARFVNNLGIRAAEIHSDRTLAQRRGALDGFKAGYYRVLVATDIAARGIDVTDIKLVLQFDLPDSADDYVHRIGRTARAGRSGIATSLAAPEQWRDVRDIEKLMGMPIPFAEDNEGKFPMAATHAARNNQRRGNGGGGRGNGRGFNPRGARSRQR